MGRHSGGGTPRVGAPEQMAAPQWWGLQHGARGRGPVVAGGEGNDVMGTHGPYSERRFVWDIISRGGLWQGEPCSSFQAVDAMSNSRFGWFGGVAKKRPKTQLEGSDSGGLYLGDGIGRKGFESGVLGKGEVARLSVNA